MNMVYYGLLGMRFDAGGIAFSPYLPAGINLVELKDIPFRQAVLDIIVKGAGTKIKSFTVNGMKQDSFRIDSTTQGSVKIEIEIEPEIVTTVSAPTSASGVDAIYPNPASNKITLTSVPANTTITVTNLSGKTVLRTKSSITNGDVKVDVSNIKAGPYFLRIGNGESKTFKLIKQ